MTEKRFVYYEHKGADYILENPNTDLAFIEMLGDCLDEKEIVNRLNGLYEENKELEQQIGNLEHTRDFCAECCERLEKENEKLKFEIRKVQRAYEQLWEHTYK